MPESGSANYVRPHSIGPSMLQYEGHLVQQLGIHWLAGKIDDSTNPTHNDSAHS